MELEGKPDFEKAMQRVEAWFNHEMLDRPPVRFSQTNAQFSDEHAPDNSRWPSLKARWFDAEFQVDSFMESIKGRRFDGETFPVFSPNLGPNVYAVFHGAELDYAEVTSWVTHCVHDWDDVKRLKFDCNNEYYLGIEELTRVALEKCAGKFMAGYTDLHGSLDCVADWRGQRDLCLDLSVAPEKVHEMLDIAGENFLLLFDHYHELLKAHGQLSVNWMNIPSRGKMHVPSCDFTSMVSTRAFREFYLPFPTNEVQHMSHSIFHVDGRGVLRHIGKILAISEINAIQWVQGVGDDQPILQWIPVIKKIQGAGKGVLVDLQLDALEPFIAETEPDGLFICVPAEEKDQPEIIKRLERW